MGIQERKERERERRRQQIMVAAKRVFSEKGFSRTTMEDIAKEAELSPGTLYLYFKNKDELFASLTLRILQYLHIRLEHLMSDAESDSEKKMEALKNALYDVYEFDSLILINMFHLQSSETLKNLSDELRLEIETLSRKAINSIATLFREGMEKDDYIDIHPVACADILWALFSGVVLLDESKRIINDEKSSVKEMFEAAFEIFKRGIRKESR